MAAPRASGRRLVLAGMVVVAAIVGRVSWFTEPYGISVDESTYMALGELVGKGGIPYADALDRKPPGLFWMFGSLGKLCGRWNIHAVHALAFGMTLILCMLAGLLCSRMTSAPRAGFLAALAFASYSACFTREIIAFNAEYPMLLACALAALCLTSSRMGEPLWRSGLLAGLAAGLAAVATLFKQYGVLVWAPSSLVWLGMHYRADRAAGHHPRRRLALSLGAIVLGIGTVMGTVALWFWKASALGLLWSWAVLDGFHYMHAGWRGAPLRLENGMSLLGVALAWFPLWLGLSRSGSWRRTLTFRIMLAGAVGAAATSCLSGRSFAHYFLPLVWFASVLAVPGLHSLWRSRGSRLVLATTLVVPVAWFAVFNTARDSFWSGAKFSRARQAQLWGAASWIREHVQPSQTIAVWGAASQLYVMSERGSGTRHVCADLVSGRQPGFDSGLRHPTPGALASYLADFDRNHPALFVDTSSAGINDYEHFPLTSVPELKEYLTSKYSLVTTVQGIDLWRRKREPAVLP